jgi:hypothetical protein
MFARFNVESAGDMATHGWVVMSRGEEPDPQWIPL